MLLFTVPLLHAERDEGLEDGDPLFLCLRSLFLQKCRRFEVFAELILEVVAARFPPSLIREAITFVQELAKVVHIIYFG